MTPFTLSFGPTDPRWSEIADFEPIIARSASAVTPSEKSSINTNRKSTTRFPMSLSSVTPTPGSAPPDFRPAPLRFQLRSHALVTTCVRMLHFTRQYRHYSRETDDFDTILFQIYWSTRVPKIIKTEVKLAKLLQK